MSSANAPMPQQFSLFELEAPSTDGAADDSSAVGKYSNFVVYVDESGDHGMQTLDANYPVFVLAFCVFYKRHYSEKVVPALHKFKFNHFGHDLIVLHEREIRKEEGDFRFFANRGHKKRFISELTQIIEGSNFILISCVIDKGRLRDKGEMSNNPYHLALGFCLETLYEFLQEKKQHTALTHVIVECRGKREDNELELEFRRIRPNTASSPSPSACWPSTCRCVTALYSLCAGGVREQVYRRVGLAPTIQSWQRGNTRSD
jgi:hypothetical protein